MNRKDKILNFLNEMDEIGESFLTTSFISQKLDISRANVSHDLNLLVKENIISKTDGRPVKYFVKKNEESKKTETDTFSYLIGFNSSLKESVKQAKAAIIYPPLGLHTLITGNTGVGKTFFAKLMYNYAIEKKKISPNKPFVTFNCADYANNPQLLISQIFGYAKGAFTGALVDKLGLIAEADGSILFLDEIHRLPPEGQEMIFYFMDTNHYGLLGETHRNRQSQVLIICATTEDSESVLLSTFLRRIPIKINLPDLDKRTPDELIELLVFLFDNESQKIKRSINLDSNCAKAILGASFNGNVGKLKSNIQTVCALSLIEDGHDADILDIKFEILPSDIKSGLFNFQRNKNYQMRFRQQLGQNIFIDYKKSNLTNNYIYEDCYSYPTQIYSFIDSKLQFMFDNKFSDQEIQHFIVNEVNQYVNLTDYILKNNGLEESVISFCRQIESEIELKYNYQFFQSLTISLGPHIQNIITNKNTKSEKKWLQKYNISSFDTYDIAMLIRNKLESSFNILVDEDEVMYLAILTSSLKRNQSQKPFHIIVAAHGWSIATQMTKVAKQLIDEDHITSIDMPLDIKPNQAIMEIKKVISTITPAKGILLLVDMGSLKQAETLISADFDIPIKTLEMVSTPLVIEALRRSTIPSIELDDLYYNLKHFRGYGETNNSDEQPNVISTKPYAILAICSSGEGIARKLKKFLLMTLEKIERNDIFVLNVSVDYIMNNKTNILMEYNILASVGVIDPKLNIPHLFLDELLSYKGDFLLQCILGSNVKKNDLNLQRGQTITTIAEVYLQDFLIYLNPKKILPIVIEFVEIIKEKRVKDDNKPILLNAYIHISCALERMLKSEKIEYNKKMKYNQDIIDVYKQSATLFQKRLDITLCDDELFYIIDMLEDHIDEAS